MQLNKVPFTVHHCQKLHFVANYSSAFYCFKHFKVYLGNTKDQANLTDYNFHLKYNSIVEILVVGLFICLILLEFSSLK